MVLDELPGTVPWFFFQARLRKLAVSTQSFPQGVWKEPWWHRDCPCFTWAVPASALCDRDSTQGTVELCQSGFGVDSGKGSSSRRELGTAQV